MVIGNRQIGESEPAFIIAEIGINHNGDISLAKKMLDEAKGAGADAFKLQTYITEKRVPRNSPIFTILKKCELSPKDTRMLFNYAGKKDIIFFSTPFDDESVDLLEALGVGLYKIASFDIVNLKLLRKISLTKKPVIISRGMSNEKEIGQAIRIFCGTGSPFALLHCISSYPAKEEDANLSVIEALKNKFACPVGFSDHTLGIEVPVLAVAAGSNIIEKHFTLSKQLKGPDHNLSAEPHEFRLMVKKVRQVEKILGSAEIRLHESERPILQYRRHSKI